MRRMKKLPTRTRKTEVRATDDGEAVAVDQATVDFAASLRAAVRSVSPSKNTQDAYWVDARKWLAFCERRSVSPVPPSATDAQDKGRRAALLGVVSDWVDEMTPPENAVEKAPGQVSSKTRARRLAALSSLYGDLKRHDSEVFNPFSPESGPRRETALRETPTPLASGSIAQALVDRCVADSSIEGRRDEAILRILWATGMRRSSIVSLTKERLTPDGDAYQAEVVAKGKRMVHVLIRGKAAEALRTYMAVTAARGAIFRRHNGVPMTGQDVYRVVRRRAEEAGGLEGISPHSFRASFITFGGAGLEERSEAAGHAGTDITKEYDRASWRGKEAFEKMPEIEDKVLDEREK